MFHVEPAVRALVLAAFLSVAVLAQTDASPVRAAPGSSGLAQAVGADAGMAAQPPGNPPPPQKSPKKRRAPRPGSGSSSSKKSKPASPSSSRRDPRTTGLGRSCTRRADCSSTSQVCLRQHDQRGKTFARGVCALPCAGMEQGLTPTRPGFPARDPQTTEKILKKGPPPRCPARYKCRSRGGDVSIDLCVRE